MIFTNCRISSNVKKARKFQALDQRFPKCGTRYPLEINEVLRDGDKSVFRTRIRRKAAKRVKIYHLFDSFGKEIQNTLPNLAN